MDIRDMESFGFDICFSVSSTKTTRSRATWLSVRLCALVFTLLFACASALAQDTQAPSVPANLAASQITSSKITLSWAASTDNVAVTGYRLDRCTGATCTSYAQIATPTSTTFTDTGRSASTTYRYRVRARDARPNWSAYSSTLNATTLAVDTQAPSTPGSLTTTSVTSTQVNLSWAASTDNVGVTGYRVDRCTGATCTTYSQIATPTTTTYSDTGRTAGTTYRYRVRARDARPNWSAYSSILNVTTLAADVQAPSIPGALTTTSVSSTQVNLSWAASTDNVAVTGYQVDRCTGATCTTYTQIATPAGTTYSDTGRTASTTYRYRVRARDARPNWSAYSSVLNVTTPAADAQAPSVPGFFTGTATSTTQINLSWAASTDNVAVTGYEVVRCTGASCSSYSQIATPSGTTYSDTGRSPSTTYRYRVRARDAIPNWSAYSNSINVTTQTPDTQAPSIPTGLAATPGSSTQSITWTASTDNVGVTGYRIERCQGMSCSNFTEVAAQTVNSFADTGLTASTVYRYRVRANDLVGNVSNYSTILDTITLPPPDTQSPTVPASLTVTAMSSSRLNVRWVASTDNIAVTAYLVERCQGPQCASFVQVATLTSLAHNDIGLVALTSYSYRVRARDAAGNLSPYSEITSASTHAPHSGPVSFNYTYDTLGRLKKAEGSDGSIIDYSYDANGNVTQISRQ